MDIIRWSNCRIEAWRLKRAMKRAIKEAGKAGQPGHEVYSISRESRAKNAPDHALVGLLDHHTGYIVPVSFVPLQSVDVPWYMVWKRFLFEGHYKRGDYPDTEVESRH